MSKTIKIWLIIATSLVLVGAIIFSVAMSTLKWNFGELSTMKFQTNQHAVEQSFNNITIETKTADVIFLPSEDGKSKVVCYEQIKLKHNVKVDADTLSINIEDTRKWYDYIGISFKHPTITVYIPQGEYGTIKVKTSTGNIKIGQGYKFESVNFAVSTGDIFVDGLTANAIDLSVSTGDITANNITCVNDFKISFSTGDSQLKDISCANFSAVGKTGDINLKNLIATQKISIKTSTGDIAFDGCDGAQIYITASTGDVKGSLLSEKVFIAKTDTGKIDVPNTITGGRCEITTDTGNIKITIK